jgi:hypothetical protein
MHPDLRYNFAQETVVGLEIIITKYTTQMTTAWRVHRLGVEETASRYGG